MATSSLLSRTGVVLISTALLSTNLLPAQSLCDSVEVVSLTYAPFTDTAMHVVLRHNGNRFLGYPHCWLVDQTADTVAREGLTLFGLGVPTESTHYMELDNGTAVPTSPFSGEVLFFFSGEEDFDYCALPVSTPLCPTECVPMQVYLYPQSGSTTTSSFPWSMTDSTGAVVGSGTLAIDITGQQQDTDTLCLLPGPYTLHIEQPVASGMEFQVGVMQQAFLSSTPMGLLAAGGGVDLPFDYYPPCFDRHTVVEEIDVAPTVIMLHDRLLTITDPTQRSIGEVTLYDATGRCVARSSANTSSFSMDLTSFAAGVHLVRVQNIRTSVQRIVLH